MADRISDGPRAFPLRLVLFLGLAAGVMTGAFAAPVHAVNAVPATGSGAGQASASYQLAADDRNRGRPPARGREEHRGGYRGGPAYYSSAPPVVFVPQGYYQQPAPLFDLTIPIVIR
jgi:hypothetical protein